VMISGGFDKSGEAVPDMEFDIDQGQRGLQAANVRPVPTQ
jgi:cold shock CspA family protein